MLTNKQKKYLRAIGNKKKSLFQIGKDGLSYNLFNTVSDSLEAHELVKVNVLKSCVEDFEELTFDLAANTHSEVVQVIGRTILLYRPSKKHHVIEVPND